MGKAFRALVVWSCAMSSVGCINVDALGAGAAAGSDAGSAGDASTADGVRFVESRTTIIPAPSGPLSAPAGIVAGDILVVTWRDHEDCRNSLPPSSWPQLAAGLLSSVSEVDNIWVGYHVVTADENETTTWPFRSCGTHMSTAQVVAFRGARDAQPLAPVLVGTAPAVACTTPTAGVDAPAVTLTSTATLLYVFGVAPAEALPALPNLLVVESSDGIAMYRAPASSPAGATVPGPHLDAQGACNTHLFSLSMGVVGADAP